MKRNSSNRKYNSGFTLVELIVVIAILAILAGVGALGYGAYIEYAKKGQDKALVGEVMHAFELANYSNPNLFAEGDSATFYFTSSGAKVLKRTGQEDLKKSLEDALGDLDSLSLTYQDWKPTSLGGTAMFDLLSSKDLQDLVDNPNSSYYQYLAAGGTASYANEMPELWEAVEKNLDARSQKDILQRVIKFSTNADAVPGIKEKWQKKEQLTMGITGLTGNEGLALEVARNYAFAAFVEGKYGNQLTGEMKKTLNGLKTTNGLLSGIYYDQCDGSEWTINGVNVVDDYINTQAEADVLAYLALMESVNTVMYTDENDLKEKVSAVVDGIAPLMNKSVDPSSYNNFLGDLGSTGSVVGFSMTKTNGVLVPSNFSDPDLNPRGSGSDSTASSGCTQSNHSSSAETLTFSGSSSNYTANKTIELCRTSGVQECKLTIRNYTDTGDLVFTADNVKNSNSDLVEFDVATKTVKIKGEGSGFATITITVKSLPSKTYTFTVNVH